MNSLQETLIALFFAGWVVLIALRVSFNSTEHSITTLQTLSTQQNIRVVSDIIEYDFRKIGHGLRNPFTAIYFADSSRIIFAYDKNPYAVYDSIRIEYTLQDAPSTPNPRDKILLRKLNSQNSTSVALGITRFRLRYYNYFGTELPTPVVADSLSKIREIEVSLTLESVEGMKETYSTSKYHTRITPKNLLIQYPG
ncbi:MAG: hypothetical protein SCK70_01890 [bacterium]|nr:hypothetical protein [bacterium]